jgi:CRISPR-associated protein Csb2
VVACSWDCVGEAIGDASVREVAELEWRKVGFWPGADLAARYGAPDHVQHYPRIHVRLRWRDAHGLPVEVTGPICLGAGRFYGLGLFAATP